MINVELDIFSGNPNPKWTLSNQEANELLDRVMADRSLAGPPKTVGGLGYRGYIISVEDDARFQRAQLPSRFYVSAKNSMDTESWLLNSTEAEKSVADGVRQVALDSIRATNQAWSQLWSDYMQGKPALPMTEGTGPAIGSPTPDIPPDTKPQIDGTVSTDACGPLAYTSDTNFAFWNGDPYSQYNNNCYNYAANYKSNTFAQPGRKANVQWSVLDCGNYSGAIGFAAAYDGHTNACWTGWEQLNCFVIWPGTDYHWYRLCANGHWCHKPGSTPARNYDNSGFWITDPYFCNRGPYTVFCSYRYFPHGWSVL